MRAPALATAPYPPLGHRCSPRPDREARLVQRRLPAAVSHARLSYPPPISFHGPRPTPQSSRAFVSPIHCRSNLRSPSSSRSSCPSPTITAAPRFIHPPRPIPFSVLHPLGQAILNSIYRFVQRIIGSTPRRASARPFDELFTRSVSLTGATISSARFGHGLQRGRHP